MLTRLARFFLRRWLVFLGAGLLLFPVWAGDKPYVMLLANTTLLSVGYVSTLRLKLSAYLLDLGHLAWAGIGAYLSAVLMMRLGIPFWANLLLVPLAVGILAAATAFPASQTAALYLALVTMSLGSVVVLFFSYVRRDLFGGIDGIRDIPAPNAIGPVSFFDPAQHRNNETIYFYLTLAVIAILLLLLWRIERSRVGLTFRSIREQPGLAEAVGIHLRRERVICFAIASAMAAVVGALSAHYVHVITPEDFGIASSFALFVYIVVGGRSHILGPALGVVLFVVVREQMRSLDQYQPILLGAALILFLLLIPDGIAGIAMRLRTRFRRSHQAGG